MKLPKYHFIQDVDSQWIDGSYYGIKAEVESPEIDKLYVNVCATPSCRSFISLLFIFVTIYMYIKMTSSFMKHPQMEQRVFMQYYTM